MYFVREADQVITLEPPFLFRDQDMICLKQSLYANNLSPIGLKLGVTTDQMILKIVQCMAVVTTVIKIP
jgi:hypothetical protein